MSHCDCDHPAWIMETGIPPTELPVSLDFVKRHVAIDPSDTTFDELLTAYIKAAEKITQNWIGKTLITRTYTAGYHFSFPPCLEIQECPFFEVTKIEYIPENEENYVDLDPDQYRLLKIRHFNFVYPNSAWPQTDKVSDAVIVYYTAGYGNTEADIPLEIKLALAMTVNKAFNDRGDCDSDKQLNLLQPAIKILRDFKPCRGIYV